jgi:putative acetyltransferase
LSSHRPDGFLIRHAGAEDLAGVTACLAAAFEAYRETYTEAAFRDTVLSGPDPQRRLREMTILVAIDAAGRIVGTIAHRMTGEAVGHLRGMAVLPELQGGGVAGRLLSAAEEELRARGCRRVTLNTTEVLGRAREFYRRHGYVATGIEGDFFGMPLIEHQKTLSGHG